MIKDLQQDALDRVDEAILRALQVDGRISDVELARKINLSPPATHTRCRRLEPLSYIAPTTQL
jgi:DNA-binding Lrp family transcriptional regulator